MSRTPLDEPFLNTFANTPHKQVYNYPRGSASSYAFTEHCVSKCGLSHVLANHLSVHSPTTQHLHPIGWLKRSMLCPRVSQRANQEAQPQSPLICLCSRCTLNCEKLKKPSMQYEFGLQMHHLCKCVSKILSCICSKHGVYLEYSNHKFACHV